MSAASSAAIAAVCERAEDIRRPGIGHNGGPVLVNEAGACALIGGGPDTPIHRATLWRGIYERRYPRPIKVGKRANRWIVAELLAVLDRAASERDTAA